MTLNELLAVVSKSGIQDIVHSGTDRLGHCLSLGCTFFEQYEHADQMTAMACMVGMILGTLEGEKLAGEHDLGVIITHKERLQIFNAQALAVFREAMAARGMPIQEALSIPEGDILISSHAPAGKVIHISSGKRKRKISPRKRL